jgi:hypothetical protein
MRRLVLLALLPLIAACGASTSSIEPPQCSLPAEVENFNVAFQIRDQRLPAEPGVSCGRVLERNVLATVERKSATQVTGIHCGFVFRTRLPLCLLKTQGRGCGIWVFLPGPHPTAFRATSQPSSACRNLNLP